MSVSTTFTAPFLYCPAATAALSTTTYTTTLTEVCPTATAAVEYVIEQVCGPSFTTPAIPPNFVVVTTLGATITTPAATATNADATIVAANTMAVATPTSSADPYVTVSAAGPSAALTRGLGLLVSGVVALALAMQ